MNFPLRADFHVWLYCFPTQNCSIFSSCIQGIHLRSMPTNDQDHANSIREVILQSPSTYEIWFRKPFCYSALTCSPNSLWNSSSDKTSNIDISLSMKRWIHSEYNLEGLSNLHPVGEVKHSLVQNMTFTFMTQKNSLTETTNRTTNIMIKKKNSESNRIMPRISD